jgi:nicotinamidase-related amidase
MRPGRPLSALLVLDVFSGFDFPGGVELFEQARAVVEPVRQLCHRFRVAERPVIFVNDNFGRWQDSFDDVVAYVLGSGPRGAAMAASLRPHDRDFELLKPKHSAFFETALPSLLSYLQVGHVMVCGLATDSCVLSTVIDAKIREFDVTVPADTTASQTIERTARTLIHLRESCGVDTPSSAGVDL